MSLRKYINRKLLYVLPILMIGLITLSVSSCGSPDQTGDAGAPNQEVQPSQQNQ